MFPLIGTVVVILVALYLARLPRVRKRREQVRFIRETLATDHTFDDRRVIASLTTVPDRINNLSPTIRSLLKQTRPPDDNGSSDNRLRHPQHYSDSKQRPLRDRSPTASERAMNVVMALSSPSTPILLMMSVVDQATENMPSAARPQQSRDEKREDAAEIPRQHRDRVQEGATF